ncbi:MAG TPA: CheR family methyltransferase [Dongiaceae bacterium]|nr:CheR family methyltransferase [Dongiaceae bacterium]
MNELVVGGGVARFREAITHSVGLTFDESKTEFLATVLQRRLKQLKSTLDDYLSKLELGELRDEVDALAQELTVAETYFFRNREQFDALREVVLPHCMARERQPRTLRILSAGCASGEEPYSIAITAREAVSNKSWRVEIEAIDLNPEALEKARRGRYSNWSIRGVRTEIQNAWFREEGRDLVLDEDIRQSVKFRLANLAAGDPILWRPESYDVIFCRNVLMYFGPEQIQKAVARMARALVPGGFLFLGHAETLRGLSDQFHLCHTHETFYYQVKGGAAFQPAAAKPAAAPVLPEVDPTFAFSATWFDEIRKASERIEALTTSPPGASNALPSPAPKQDISPLLDLLRKEQFAEALDHVKSLAGNANGGNASRDRDMLVLEAMLLTQNGKVAAAKEVCLNLLRTDELNPAAHYVLALCFETAGSQTEALEQYRVAIYLDPGFAMPHLHLGLLARRLADQELARRELGQALILLRREDVSRILLFGGGFNREALIALCESALLSSGGKL